MILIKIKNNHIKMRKWVLHIDADLKIFMCGELKNFTKREKNHHDSWQLNPKSGLLFILTGYLDISKGSAGNKVDRSDSATNGLDNKAILYIGR